MNRSHISGFSNRLPRIDWKTNLPKFRDQGGHDVVIHLVKFQMHMRRLGFEFHEDCLMKMFIVSLEGKDRPWYEKLLPSSLYIFSFSIF